ncbi:MULTISPECIES: DUF2771 domain-containing protein [unclassified Rhodococcus (in: high G+C Gram-positive bacteria)]|jgi:hypothetical protein|uniref:DUF2771 domain-containing protein n=1 Tax=unclassified Rhodococcus (in: high G+C Gram-positive bacteria) TaxID=192944 RepID=UPI0002D6435C|nr:DUF2771 domain-containing protein [Rhodococcus sp. DK17]
MQARTKKILALIAVGLMVVLVAFVGVLYALVRNSSPRLPEITAFAHNRAEQIPPLAYCNLYLEDCTTGDLAELDVPPGSSLQLSLPQEIVDAPWRMLVVYQDASGQVVVQEQAHRAGETRAVTVPSSDDLQLAGVEIQLPSAVIDEQGLTKARAAWSIKTA